MKALFALGGWAVLFVILLGVFGWMLPDYAGVFHVVLLLATAGEVLVIAVTFSYFAISVPEVMGLITVNLFTGGTNEYGPGLHFKWLWEQVKDDNFWSIEYVTFIFDENYAASNGVMMEVKAYVKYRPKVGHLVRYKAVDETTIKEGLKGDMSAELSTEIHGRLPEEARAAITEMREKVRRKFEVGQVGHSYEDRFGIDVDEVGISDIDYEPSYQQALSNKQQMQRHQEAALALVEAAGGLVNLSYDVALTNVLVNAGVVEKKVNVTEIGGSAKDSFVTGIVALLQGIGAGSQPNKQSSGESKKGKGGAK